MIGAALFRRASAVLTEAGTWEAENAEPEEEFRSMTTRQRISAWQWLVLRVRCLLSVAHLYQITSDLPRIQPLRNPEAAASSSGTMTSMTEYERRKLRTAQIEGSRPFPKGKALSRLSRKIHSFGVEPKDCSHTEDNLVAGGGKNNHYSSCQKCGARWDRPQADLNPGQCPLCRLYHLTVQPIHDTYYLSCPFCDGSRNMTKDQLFIYQNDKDPEFLCFTKKENARKEEKKVKEEQAVKATAHINRLPTPPGVRRSGAATPPHSDFVQIKQELEEDELEEAQSDISMVERPMIDLEYLVFQTNWPQEHPEHTTSMIMDNPALTAELISAKERKDAQECQRIIDHWKAAAICA